MSDWIEQYSAGLDERDAREQAHKSYIDAYTKLADRTATLESRPRIALPASPQPPESSKECLSTPTKSKSTAAKEVEQNPTNVLARLRGDLATTQKARSTLQSQVDELSSTLKALELQQKTSTSQIFQLTRQKLDLERRVKDREDEIKGKGKLVEQAHDEMVSQGLQLNMSEARSEKLETENKELVARWMKRVGEEAERVNRESQWE